MSVALGISPASLLELDGAMVDALEQAAGQRWTVIEELLAMSFELAHAHYRAFLAAHSSGKTRLPDPIRLPRPGEESFKPTPVVGATVFALEYGPKKGTDAR